MLKCTEKYILQHNVNLPVIEKLVTLTKTNVEEKPAKVKQQSLLMDDKDKTH